MKIKSILFVLLVAMLFACSADGDNLAPDGGNSNNQEQTPPENNDDK